MNFTRSALISPSSWRTSGSSRMQLSFLLGLPSTLTPTAFSSTLSFWMVFSVGKPEDALHRHGDHKRCDHSHAQKACARLPDDYITSEAMVHATSQFSEISSAKQELAVLNHNLYFTVNVVSTGDYFLWACAFKQWYLIAPRTLQKIIANRCYRYAPGGLCLPVRVPLTRRGLKPSSPSGKGAGGGTLRHTLWDLITELKC